MKEPMNPTAKHAPAGLMDGTRLAPYWWDEVPRPAMAQAPLPATVDVAVIGAGYTGLHAALQTARGQRTCRSRWPFLCGSKRRKPQCSKTLD